MHPGRHQHCIHDRCDLQAAWAAIQVYLELHQKPAAVNSADDDLANSGLSAEELKKLKLKRKKVQHPKHLMRICNSSQLV